MKNLKIVLIALGLVFAFNLSAQKKISDLPELLIPLNSDVLPIVNNGVTKKIQVSNLLSSVNAGVSTNCLTDTAIYLTNTLGLNVFFQIKGCFEIEETNVPYILRVKGYADTTINNFSNQFNSGVEPIDTTIQPSVVDAFFYNNLDTMFAQNRQSPINGINMAQKQGNNNSSISIVAETLELSTGINNQAKFILDNENIYIEGVKESTQVNYVLGVDNLGGADSLKAVPFPMNTGSDDNFYNTDGQLTDHRAVDANAKSIEYQDVLNFSFYTETMSFKTDNLEMPNYLKVSNTGRKNFYISAPFSQNLYTGSWGESASDTLSVFKDEFQYIALSCSTLQLGSDTSYIELPPSPHHGENLKILYEYNGACMETMPTYLGIIGNDGMWAVNGGLVAYIKLCDYHIISLVYSNASWIVEKTNCQ